MGGSFNLRIQFIRRYTLTTDACPLEAEVRRTRTSCCSRHNVMIHCSSSLSSAKGRLNGATPRQCPLCDTATQLRVSRRLFSRCEAPSRKGRKRNQKHLDADG